MKGKRIPSVKIQASLAEFRKLRLSGKNVRDSLKAAKLSPAVYYRYRQRNGLVPQERVSFAEPAMSKETGNDKSKGKAVVSGIFFVPTANLNDFLSALTGEKSK
jgi:hypothetical protein